MQHFSIFMKTWVHKSVESVYNKNFGKCLESTFLFSLFLLNHTYCNSNLSCCREMRIIRHSYLMLIANSPPSFCRTRKVPSERDISRFLAALRSRFPANLGWGDKRLFCHFSLKTRDYKWITKNWIWQNITFLVSFKV